MVTLETISRELQIPHHRFAGRLSPFYLPRLHRAPYSKTFSRCDKREQGAARLLASLEQFLAPPTPAAHSSFPKSTPGLGSDAVCRIPSARLGGSGWRTAAAPARPLQIVIATRIGRIPSRKPGGSSHVGRVSGSGSGIRPSYQCGPQRTRTFYSKDLFQFLLLR